MHAQRARPRPSTPPIRPAADPADPLAGIARGQDGLATFDQTRAAGISIRHVEHQVRRGAWEVLTRRVLRSCSAPVTDRQTARAALLDLGADASLTRTSAHAVWEHPSGQLAPTHVVVPRARRTGLLEPAQVHTSTWLTDEWVTIVNGLRVTVPAVTILDVAGDLSTSALERLFDWYWNRDLVRPSQVEAVLAAIGRNRAGRRALAGIVAERCDADQPPGSNTEARFAQLLRSDCQPAMRRQVLLGDERPIGRVDFVDDEALLVVEVQSRLFHGSLSDQRRDAERAAGLHAEGWLVHEVWEDRVWNDGPSVATEVGRLRRTRRLERGRTAF